MQLNTNLPYLHLPHYYLRRNSHRDNLCKAVLRIVFAGCLISKMSSSRHKRPLLEQLLFTRLACAVADRMTAAPSPARRILEQPTASSPAMLLADLKDFFACDGRPGWRGRALRN